MKELTAEKISYLSELRKHENKWVAVLKSEHGKTIVGSGKDAVEAKRNAQIHGVNEAFLQWVRPFDGKCAFYKKAFRDTTDEEGGANGIYPPFPNQSASGFVVAYNSES